MSSSGNPSAPPYPVRIAGTGSYLPERIMTNRELEESVDTSDEWITSRTGIRERRIAKDGEFTSHLASEAARRALEQAGVAAAEIELIIVATITPDTLTPATACYVQQQIGSLKAVAFDVSAACSGFLYAMEFARHAVGAGAFRNALIIGAEKLSAFVDWNDRNTCVLFGDGAGAAVLLPSTNGGGKILSSTLGTDGAQAELLNIPGGGSACPALPGTAPVKPAVLSMQGREVFKHAVNAMRQAAIDGIAAAGLTRRISASSTRSSSASTSIATTSSSTSTNTATPPPRPWPSPSTRRTARGASSPATASSSSPSGPDSPGPAP